MKKFAYISMAIVTILILPGKIYAQNEQVDSKLLSDTLLVALYPYITKELTNYYGYLKQFGYEDAKILSIVRENDSLSFITKVQVTTFEHAHDPPYSKEIMTFDVSPNGVQTIRYQHEGDNVEKEIKAFYHETLEDIKQTFHLNLASYSSYTYNQLEYQADINKETGFTSLYKIAEDIVTNILFRERKIPYKNVIDPVTFIKGNSGYILFKKSDGTNVIYRVQKKDDHWIVIEKTSKPGRKMEDALPWYI